VRIGGPWLAFPDVNGVIETILGRNAGLLSYQAHAHLDVEQVTFPYLHPVLDGTVYYSSPGYVVYDFPNTPSYLQGITRVEGAVGMASRWRECYNITLLEKPNAYVLRMVPKIRGEVSEMDVTVDKTTANPQFFQWSYYNPGDSVTLAQTFELANGFNVVTAQYSEITKHHIRAKARANFDTFVYNFAVPTPTATPSDPLHHCDN